MRRDFRNFRSWSLILNSGLLVRVVTMEVLSLDFSPGLLTPIVASSTRKMSYPPSLILATTSAICSESESDSLIASPSSFINCFNCWSTEPPFLTMTAGPPDGSIHWRRARATLFRDLCAVIVTPNIDKIDGDDKCLQYPKGESFGSGRGSAGGPWAHIGRGFQGCPRHH